MGSVIWKRARLIKRKTEDGLFEVEDHVPLGKVYVLDMSTLVKVTLVHGPTGEVHTREIVYPLDLGDKGWIPMELLELIDE